MAEFKKTAAPARTGGPPPPMGTFRVSDPRCRVCQHSGRREIDMMLSLGWSAAATRRHWNQIEAQGGDDEDYFKKSSMENHARKHLSSLDAANRNILEARARAEGMDVDMVEGFILTKSAAAEMIVHQGLAALQRGDANVEAKDILAALETLMKLDESRSTVAEEVMLREIRAFMAAVKRHVSDDLWKAIHDDYKAELGEPRAIAPPTTGGTDDD